MLESVTVPPLVGGGGGFIMIVTVSTVGLVNIAPPVGEEIVTVNVRLVVAVSPEARIGTVIVWFPTTPSAQDKSALVAV